MKHFECTVTDSEGHEESNVMPETEIFNLEDNDHRIILQLLDVFESFETPGFVGMWFKYTRID